MTLERLGNDAVFTFRNTSATALDITPEELMERFVRGDSSRSTEGNGLGLSIAGSLSKHLFFLSQNRTLPIDIVRF